MYIGTDKEKRCVSVLPIFGKGLIIHLLIFMQFFNGQVTITDGAIVYKGSEIVVDQENKTSPPTIARIYVSSQAQIFNGHLISGDIEIIAEVDSKKEKKPTKAIVLKESQEAKIAKIVPQKVNIDAPKFRSLESSTSIAFNKIFSEKIVSASSSQFKHFINEKFFSKYNWFIISRLGSINLYIADFFCTIHSLTFSVRPPPFLA